MSARADRRGFTLLEVMIATIILSIGLVVLLTSFTNCQKVMKASQDNETAQYVLAIGETVYPIPSPDLVTGDPLDDEQLNIQPTSAEELLDDLDIPASDMPKDRRDELSTYTFERAVDEVDDEELKRAGYLYRIYMRKRRKLSGATDLPCNLVERSRYFLGFELKRYRPTRKLFGIAKGRARSVVAYLYNGAVNEVIKGSALFFNFLYAFDHLSLIGGGENHVGHGKTVFL